jgi:hypothetical protein
MASADGKTNPFNLDGKSGAIGNQGGGGDGSGRGGAGPSGNIPPSLRQKHGSLRNPESVAKGGPFLTTALDAPSDRQGQVGTTADPSQRRPFRLDGSGGSDEGAVGTADGPGAVGLDAPPDEPAQD